jgi:hypothetical protein
LAIIYRVHCYTFFIIPVLFCTVISKQSALHNILKRIRDLYRGIIEFKKGYQPKTNLVKDERGDLLALPQKSLTR